MKVEILEQNGHKFLWIDGELWMWDLPFEVKIQQEFAEQAHGDVLVVGLGLGIVQKLLLKNKKVNADRLITIEKHEEVYDCCRNKGIIVGDSVGGIFICDWFDAICGQEECEKYDFVIGDIWPEIDPSQLDSYFCFQEKAQEFLKPNGKILAWGKGYYEYLLEHSFDYSKSSNGKKWCRESR